MGRPTKYNQRVADAICARVARGESMKRISGLKLYPSLQTMMRWLGQHEEFRDKYAKARLAAADYHFEEMLEIADNSTGDWVERDNGAVAYNAEAVARAKLRIETRKWIMSRLNPRKYGDQPLVDQRTVNNITRIEIVGVEPEGIDDGTRPLDNEIFTLIGHEGKH